MADSAEVIGGCLAVVLVGTAFSALEAFLIALLWNWAAPQLWPAAPHLSFLLAWAVLILINVATSKVRLARKESK